MDIKLHVDKLFSQIQTNLEGVGPVGQSVAANKKSYGRGALVGASGVAIGGYGAKKGWDAVKGMHDNAIKTHDTNVINAYKKQQSDAATMAAGKAALAKNNPVAGEIKQNATQSVAGKIDNAVRGIGRVGKEVVGTTADAVTNNPGAALGIGAVGAAAAALRRRRLNMNR